MVFDYIDYSLGACSVQNIAIDCNTKNLLMVTFGATISSIFIFWAVVLYLQLYTTPWECIHWWSNSIVVLSVVVNIVCTLVVDDGLKLFAAHFGVCLSILLGIFVAEQYQFASMAFAVVSMAYEVYVVSKISKLKQQ